jgi:2-desacetyl-2-hydroxyethyl bacteriochlorophyllide A dehydrogenase
MRAVILDGERSVTVGDVEDPKLPGPDGIVVAITHTAICGSDLHLYHGAISNYGIRLGHEFVGTVAEAGPDVRSVRVGDTVAVSGVIGCGHCVSCLARDPGICRTGGVKVFGSSLDLPGGQAQAAAVPAADASVLPVPDGVTPEQAVLLTDILPTGYLGALRADIKPGDTIAVIGLGPVGVFALQTAQLFGPARVLAVDPVPGRRARAAELGAEAIDPGDGGTVEQILAATGGRGVDAVIEAVGANQTITDAIMSTAPGGTISVIGVNTSRDLPFPAIVALMRRLTFRMTLASIPSTWDALVPLVSSGRLRPEEVFTHKMGLSDAAEAYRLFDSREDGVLKVLLDPSA